MESPNFEFIKEFSEYFYEKCCQVDILIAMGYYEKAIASSRKIIECIVNPDDEIKLVKFLEQNKDKFSRRTYKYLDSIRWCGNRAIHPNTYEWKKQCADNIAMKMHHVVIVELYKKRYHQKGIIDDYIPITNKNEWFLTQVVNPDIIVEALNSAYKAIIELAIKEEVASNLDDMKKELAEENKKVLNEIFEEYGINKKEEIVLSPKQLDASHYWNEKNNNLIVQAGPGSGKTTVLIERVKFLINEKNVAPESILLITFTEKAANELKQRLFEVKELKRSDISRVHVSTIHGFCRTVLKKYSFLGLDIIDDENNEKKLMYIKNKRERLGLDDKYGYIPNSELKIVAKKFDEMDSFEVNADELIKYIEDDLLQMPSKEKRYLEYIDKTYTDSKVTTSSVKTRYRDRLRKHKFLTIIKAYKEYKNLIKQDNVFDFNRLQKETKEFLKENYEDIGFKNILVDEFQDTDQIQMEIFNLLEKNCQSVTYVGDPDQSIFSWRGSTPEFFEEIRKRDDFELIRLDKNYRSPKNIVDFNEAFMSEQRGSYMDFKVKNESNGDLFYIKNHDAIDEVQSIVNIIKFLIENERLNSLSDIAIISNSVVYKTELFNELELNGIDYTVRGLKDIANDPEIIGILALLWYLTDSMDDDLFSLKTFSDSRVNDVMFNFTEETLNVLLDNKDCHNFSTLSRTQLEDLGIIGDDLETFSNLNELKREFNDNDLTILDLYYKLINITNYVERKYDILSSGEEKAITNRGLFNLSLISQKIKSYMDMNDEKDLEGLFEFLIENYQDFSSPLSDFKEENKVHILTAHKSKGLEFPFVIVSSLSDGYFPKDLKPNPYKIPLNMLFSKQFGDYEGDSTLYELEKDSLFEEQMRVIYVALTRAKQALILSTKGNSDVVNNLSDFNGIKELSRDNLDAINFFSEEEYKKHKDLISLSFTSMENYKNCSHFYNLAYNYNFISPQNTSMIIGSIAHNCLDAINTKTVNDEIDDDEVKKIIKRAKDSNPSLIDNETFDEVLESVEFYYEDYIKEAKWKILDSEYPFTLFKEKNNIKFNFNGQIDLIIQEDEEDDLKISLVDYKTSVTEKSRYLDQLHIYAMAILENPNFEGKDIQNLIRYPLTGDNLKTDPFDINRKNKLEDEMYETAKYISNYKFKKTNIISKCKNCSLKDICNNG